MVDFTLVNHLFEKLQNQKLQGQNSYLIFAESLTAGLISSEFSKIPGSSNVLWGGFVVYSPVAKQKLLGVPKDVIDKHGVISAECALSMAMGALKMAFSKNQIFPKYSLAVTGVAGPPSRFDEQPVGTVYIAVAKILNADTSLAVAPYNTNAELKFYSDSRLFHFAGNRNTIREQTLNSGIKMLIDIV